VKDKHGEGGPLPYQLGLKGSGCRGGKDTRGACWTRRRGQRKVCCAIGDCSAHTHQHTFWIDFFAWGLAKDRGRRGWRAWSCNLLRADSHRVWRAVFAEKAPLPKLEMALLSSLISSMRAHAEKRASETDSRRLSLSMMRLASRDEE
jgi:hypothetical protein